MTTSFLGGGGRTVEEQRDRGILHGRVLVVAVPRIVPAARVDHARVGRGDVHAVCRVFCRDLAWEEREREGERQNEEVKERGWHGGRG